MQGIDVKPEATHVLLKLTGTTGEGLLLKHQTGHPGMLLRVHRCTAECTADRHADDLLHGHKARKPGVAGAEEGWLRNLEITPVDDELAALRLRSRELAPGAVGSREDAGKEVADVEKEGGSARKKDSGKKKKKKKGKSPKRKKKKSEDRGSRSPGGAKGEKAAGSKKKRKSSSLSSSASVALDGRKPRAASTKTYDALYAGTGLDRREKVRKRVLKRAKRAARRRSKEKVEERERQQLLGGGQSFRGGAGGRPFPRGVEDPKGRPALPRRFSLSGHHHHEGQPSSRGWGYKGVDWHGPGGYAVPAATSTSASERARITGAGHAGNCSGSTPACTPITGLGYTSTKVQGGGGWPDGRPLVSGAKARAGTLRKPQPNWSGGIELSTEGGIHRRTDKDVGRTARRPESASKGQGKSKDKDDFRKDRDKGRGKGSSKDKGKQSQKEDQPSK